MLGDGVLHRYSLLGAANKQDMRAQTSINWTDERIGVRKTCVRARNVDGIPKDSTDTTRARMVASRHVAIIAVRDCLVVS